MSFCILNNLRQTKENTLPIYFDVILKSWFLFILMVDSIVVSSSRLFKCKYVQIHNEEATEQAFLCVVFFPSFASFYSILSYRTRPHTLGTRRNLAPCILCRHNLPLNVISCLFSSFFSSLISQRLNCNFNRIVCNGVLGFQCGSLWFPIKTRIIWRGDTGLNG